MIRPLTKPVDEWKRAIIESAQYLFVTKGYEKTSIEGIMKKVGAAKGSFYRHFNNKEDVLNAIVDSWADQYAQGVSDVLRNDSLSINQKLLRILEVVNRMMVQPEGTESFFLNEDKNLLLKLQDKMVDLLTPELSRALEVAISRNEIEIGDPHVYASFIIYGSLGILNNSANPSRGDTSDELKRIVSNLFNLEDRS